MSPKEKTTYRIADIPEKYRPVLDHRKMLLGCIGLACALATLVLSLLEKIAPQHAVILLSISAICFGISLLLPAKR
ncbi:MAG TPA: hypothetical protein O0X50_01935 [Methanocorpusculum sp.]|nr:hypothetical protein [Methanocorpusculum sp.]